MENLEKYIWYFKYHWSLVEDWIMDARKSAEALLWIDQLMRYFMIREYPTLQQYELEIPVRIKKWSWEALIPDTIQWWIALTWWGAFFTWYVGSIAVKAWSDGLLETWPVKDLMKIAKWSILIIQWIIKIASHLGRMGIKKFENAELRKIWDEDYVVILNDLWERLKVPRKYLEEYSKCPEKILSKNAYIIEENREFTVGFFQETGDKLEVSINSGDRDIFYYESEDDILFPELEHWKYVELEGEITRWNEKTNTIGLQYQKHILTCKPMSWNIATFKEQIISREDGHFFPPVVIKWIVDRTDKKWWFKEKKPMIIFSEISVIESDDWVLKLF